MSDKMDPLVLGANLRAVWEDQAAFNRLLREPPTTLVEMAAQAKSFVLYTESELHELLRVFHWKTHRRPDIQDNPAHREEELADIFKCVLSLMQICGMTPEALIDAYWRKTAVVRQRYQEEWVARLDGPCVIVDIDNVLCDYTAGFCEWILSHGDAYPEIEPSRILSVLTHRWWDTAERLGVTEEYRQSMKHDFRVSGAKRRLPVFDDACAFLTTLRNWGLKIVLLTSRPIDKYPNVYTDTLLWLQHHQLPFDFIWWAADKGERVLDAKLRSQVQFVVDDDLRHLLRFAGLGLPCYLLDRGGRTSTVSVPDTMRYATSLNDVLLQQTKETARA